MLLLAGVSFNAEHLVAVCLAILAVGAWALEVGCFSFDLLQLSSVFAGCLRGLTVSNASATLRAR